MEITRQESCSATWKACCTISTSQSWLRHHVSESRCSMAQENYRACLNVEYISSSNHRHCPTLAKLTTPPTLGDMMAPQAHGPPAAQHPDRSSGAHSESTHTIPLANTRLQARYCAFRQTYSVFPCLDQYCFDRSARNEQPSSIKRARRRKERSC